MKIVVIGALPESLVLFRQDLMKAMIAEGHSVVAMAAPASDAIEQQIVNLGAKYRPYRVSRNGLQPLADLQTLLMLIIAFWRERPDVILAYTIKPVIWGGIAAALTPKARFFAMITGLGYAFQGGSLKRNLLRQLIVFLYKSALMKSKGVIFQNFENKQVFCDFGIVPEQKTARVAGSGVNVGQFCFSRTRTAPFVFLMISRLLGEKGVCEYAEAARVVKRRFPNVQFRLLGPEDSSPDGIPMSQVDKWSGDGVLDYLGQVDDVRPYLEDCTVFVLPSYHEGMPRTVLEAMAIGRPILTTDVPGCNETVVDGRNGFLVEAKDAGALAERMQWLIENADQLHRMGQASRQYVEKEFDVHKVNAELLDIVGAVSD